jgi:CCR4-NOT transcriptional complex subunit CAF120
MALTSSHWDARNRGFIPPSQLRELSQSAMPAHDFTQQQQPEQGQLNQPKPSSILLTSSPPRPSTTSSHTRSSSLFSFRSKPSNTSTRSSSPIPPNKLIRSQSPLSKQPPTVAQVDPSPSVSDPISPSPQSPWQNSQRSHSLSRSVQRSPSGSDSPPLHPEIRSVISLTVAHTQKIYYSGPLVRKLERQSDGQTPANDAGWRDVWVQLYGTKLSIWDMEEVKNASEQGKEVPPSYVNITEAVSSRSFWNSHLFTLTICPLVHPSHGKYSATWLSGCSSTEV